MNPYRVHTIETAPERSRPALRTLNESFGMIPNLAATMAESPPLLDAFVGAFGPFHGGGFTSGQRQALLLANAVANACAWAVAFHSTLALKAGVDRDDVRAIRERRAPKDAKLAALTGLTRALLEKRGHLDETELAAFGRAGFGPAQVLEVVAGLAVSLMANFAGNITRPELEPVLQAQAWDPEHAVTSAVGIPGR